MSSEPGSQNERFQRVLARIGWMRQQIFIAIAIFVFAQVPNLPASMLLKIALTISLIVLVVKSLNDAQINAEILRELSERKASEKGQT